MFGCALGRQHARSLYGPGSIHLPCNASKAGFRHNRPAIHPHILPCKWLMAAITVGLLATTAGSIRSAHSCDAATILNPIGQRGARLARLVRSLTPLKRPVSGHRPECTATCRERAAFAECRGIEATRARNAHRRCRAHVAFAGCRGIEATRARNAHRRCL